MNSPQLPDAFLSVLGLGAAQGYFPVKNINRWSRLNTMLICLAAALAAVVYGFYQAYVWSKRYGSVMIADKLALPLLAAGILVLFSGMAGWGAYVSWNKAVAVYERGLACRDRKGIRTWRWEDVDRLFAAITRHYTNGIYTGTTHVFTLVNTRMEQLVLNDAYVRVEELGKAIEQNTFPRLYEQAAGRYTAGEMVNFGPVVLNRGGIQVGKKLYPWSEVQQVTIHQGILRISRKTGGLFGGTRVSASAIPNLRVLLSIIHQVVGVNPL